MGFKYKVVAGLRYTVNKVKHNLPELILALVFTISFIVILFLSGCGSAIAKATPETIAAPGVIAAIEEGGSTIGYMGFLPSVMVAGFVIGIIILALGQRLIGGAVSVACVAGLVLSITFIKYGWLIAILGVIILLAAIGFVIWQLIVNRKVITELIMTAEIAKDRLPQVEKEAVFKVLAAQLQNPTTKKIVKKVTDKMVSLP